MPLSSNLKGFFCAFNHRIHGIERMEHLSGRKQMTQVTLATVCMNVAHDKKTNIEKYLHFIDEAAALNVRLLVFPEVSLQGYLKKRGSPGEPEVIEMTRYFRSTAETIPGPTTERIHELAERHNMYIQIGMAESARVGQVFYNTAVLVGPEGVVGKFRKLHDRGEWARVLQWG
ncbi:MAG: hypothetical protein A2Z14_08420 [Chloroflexi bacterium RBG_16_48_8]|nr:MAG: hypothetical protein A2Z14_08420 [Chloroflexi bacterium RBG_16_48_8]